MKNLFKITSLLGLSNIALLSASLIKNKIIAVFLGTTGMGVISQASTFLNILTGISTFGMQQGITKFVAESDNEKYNSRKILFFALEFVVFISVILFFILYFLADKLTLLAFSDKTFKYAIVILTLSSPFISAGLVLSFYFKGKRNISLLFKVNLLSAISGLIVSIPLIIYFNITGAVIQVALTAAMSFIFYTGYFLFREKKSAISEKIKLSDNINIFKTMIHYGSVTAACYLFSVISLFIIKGLIIRKLGFKANGLYQATLIISGIILSFLYETYWSYYFPTICREKDIIKRKTEFISFTNFLILTTTTAIILMFWLNKFIIPLLFSKDFLEVEHLIKIRLLGDFFYILSWPIQGFFLVDAQFKYLVIAFSLLPTFILLSLSFLFQEFLGLIGIFYAYLISMVIYFFIHVKLFKKKYPALANSKDMNDTLFKIVYSSLTMSICFLILNTDNFSYIIFLVLFFWALLMTDFKKFFNKLFKQRKSLTINKLP